MCSTKGTWMPAVQRESMQICDSLVNGFLSQVIILLAKAIQMNLTDIYGGCDTAMYPCGVDFGCV